MNDEKAHALHGTMGNYALNELTAEWLLAGALLIDRDATAKAAQWIKPEHIHDPAVKLVFEACMRLWRAGIGVDLLTVTNDLRRSGKLAEAGGPWQLVEFSRRIASPDHLEYHCHVIREDFALRVLADGGAQASLGAGKGADPKAIISGLSHELNRAMVLDVDGSVNAGELAFSLCNDPKVEPSIYLGIQGLDNMVFIQPGNVVSISADPGVGKTALLLSAVLNLLPQYRTWFVSLEMPARELVSRALCQLALVDIDLMIQGRLDEHARVAMGRASSEYASMLSKLDIDDTGSMSIDEFSARAEHKVKHEGVGLIALDYAQLLEYDAKLWKNKADGYEAISKGIRATARKLNVPILCIVHVNKEGKEHGSIQFEKDAHVRLKLTREMGAPMMNAAILKNRNGRPGSIDVPCEMRWGIVGRHGPPEWANPNGNTPTNTSNDEPF